MKINSSLKGIFASQIAAISYASFGIFSRIIEKDFDPVFQTASRTVIILIITGIILVFFKNVRKYNFQYKKLWPAYILLASAINIFYFLAVTKLPLGAAMFIFYASSLIFTYITGKLLYKEKLGFENYAALVIAVIGAGLIMINTGHEFNPVSLIYPVISGGSFGMLSSFSKIISKENSPFVITAFTSAGNFLFLLPLSLLLGENINLNIFSYTWLINIIFALATIVSQVTTIIAFKNLEVNRAGLLLLTEVLYLIVFGWVIYSEEMNINEVTGGLLIIIALVLPGLSQKNKFT